MKRAIRAILILIVLSSIAAGVYYSMLVPPREIVLTGIVTTDDVIVSAQIQGRLEKLLVNQGDVVKAGQRLAVIDPEQWQADVNYYASTEKQAATQVSESQDTLRYQEEQTQSQILQAQADLASAQAQVKQSDADLENARLTFEREDSMYKAGSETQQAYDLARTTFDAQKARRESLVKQVAAADAALGIARASLQQVNARRAAVQVNEHQLAATGVQKDKAKILLDYTQILAPIDGTIDTRTALQGEVVNPTQAIVTIINPDDLWVRADVEETYISRIHLGDKMVVRLPSGEEREGVVFFRGIDADFATQRDVSRTKRDIKTFEVPLRCDNRDRSLAVGMTAYVTLPLSK